MTGPKSKVQVPKSVEGVAASVVLALALADHAAAKPVRPVEAQTKIDFLIGEVKSSQAVFIRNGKEYRADRAASHLARKLKSAGRRVQTVRQFIIGIASHSEESGKPYEIRWPDGSRQPLSEWLLERLDFCEKEHLPRPEAASPH
jgi:hypothetical protein